MGGLPGRERESSAEEEPEGRRGGYVQAGEAVDGESSGRGNGERRVEHVRLEGRGTWLQETGRGQEREAGKKTRQLHGLLVG